MRAYTVWVEIFEVFLIPRFSWVADDTKIIHVETARTVVPFYVTHEHNITPSRAMKGRPSFHKKSQAEQG